MTPREVDDSVLIWTGHSMLDGRIIVPRGATAAVLVAEVAGHAGYRRIAERLARKYGVLVADLLSADEQQVDARMGHFRNNVYLLAERMREVVAWMRRQQRMKAMPVAFFGTGSVAAGALLLEAENPHTFDALVLAGARTDLVANSLPLVLSPTLLLAPDSDPQITRDNRGALEALRCEKKLDVMDDMHRLSSEDPMIDVIADRAASWIHEHLPVAADAYGML